MTVKLLKKLTLATATTLMVAHALAAPKIIWTAVYSSSSPISDKVTQEYCNSHTPSVVVATIDQITSEKGSLALNGIRVRYLSYNLTEKDNLNFLNIEANISGKDDSGFWSSPMKIYAQALMPNTVSYSIWSTAQCRGTLVATPTVIQKPSVSKPAPVAASKQSATNNITSAS